jgi:hypothetical protein
MAVNEVQEFVRGSFATPVSADGGTVDMTFDGQTVNNVDLFALSAGSLQTALESLSNIEPGDVSVTGFNPFLIEFTGIYAGMDVPQISLTANSGFETANTIDINVTQSGAADTYMPPTIGGSFTDGTNDVPGTNEVQNINLNGATTGTFDITWNGNTQTFTVGVTSMSSICDTIIGSGYYSINDFGTSWDITFQGFYAETDVSDITISNNTTDGSPAATTLTQGVAAITGTPATQQITFSPVAESGQWSLNGSTVNWDQAVTGSWGSYGADGGSAASGTVNLTYISNGSGQSPLSVSDINLQYLFSTGQQHIFVVTLSDSPDQGQWKLLENGSQVGVDMNWNASDTDVQSQISGYGGGYTASGGIGGPWTCTSNTNINHTWTGGESGSQFLRRSVAVDIRTVTEGEPDPDPPTSNCPGIVRIINQVVRREIPGGQRVINRRINVKCFRVIKLYR